MYIIHMNCMKRIKDSTDGTFTNGGPKNNAIMFIYDREVAYHLLLPNQWK